MPENLDKLKKIIGVALGEIEGDLILKNGIVFNTISGEIYTADIIVADDIIAGVGSYDNAAKVIDVKGKFVLPGLIDGHVHVESSMLGLGEFSRALISHGVTTVIADPHEFTNIFGKEGIRYFLKESEKIPLNFYLMIPSCIPPTSLETAAAMITADEYPELMADPRVLGLAEMMNFPGVIRRDEAVLKKLLCTGGKLIDGHAPKLSGRELCAYISGGVTSEHECVSTKEAQEKLRLGMYIMLREGSATKNLHDLLPLVNKFNSQRCFLATDDLHPDDIQDGHIDQLVRTIIKESGNAMRAVRMASLNAAEYYGLRNLGAIAPGKLADLLVVPEMESFKLETVIKSGRVIYEHGNFFWKKSDTEEYLRKTYPGFFSSFLVKDFSRKRLSIPVGTGKMRVINILPDQLLTSVSYEEPTVSDGLVQCDLERDLLKLCVVERHRATGNIGLGFVKGLKLKRGALAASIAHDSHNIIAAGTNDEDIYRAVSLVIGAGGGIAIACGSDSKVLSLPMGGLMSPAGIDEVAGRLRELKREVAEWGTDLRDPFMQLSFLALPVIPEIKLTDLGLVNVLEQSLISLWTR
ncbi:MAG: adenine deaminase [Candidatus Wallbacteria bacterium]|nr:adenine deaminase [Candidatus Wallbacteria bacterium]